MKFQYKIKSLSAFIDELGLITIFEKNTPIGCLVQEIKKESLSIMMFLSHS